MQWGPFPDSAAWSRALSVILVRSIRNGYLPTFAVQLVVMAAGLITLRLAALAFGTDGFGTYTVSRRCLSIIGFPALLGLGVSLPRYMGSSSSLSDKDNFFLASIFLSIPSLSILPSVLLVAPTWAATFLFGDKSFSYMTAPLAAGVIGLNLYTVVYSYFRGQLRMWSANFLQCLAMGIVPPFSVVLSDGNVGLAITLLGVSWALLSLTILFLLLKRIWPDRAITRVLWRNVKILAGYGIPRIPAEFALFGLFAVPPLLIVRTAGIERAGFVSLGLTLVQAGGSMFATAGIILLPYLSGLFIKGKMKEVRRLVGWTLGLSCGLVCLGVISFEIMAPQLVPAIMGKDFSAAVSSLNVLVLSSVPYVFYLMLRTPLDAVSKVPYNSLSLSAAFATVAVLIWLGNVICAELAILIGMTLLGSLSIASWHLALHRAATGKAMTPGVTGTWNQ